MGKDNVFTAGISKEDIHALQQAEITVKTYTDNLNAILGSEHVKDSKLVELFTKKKIDAELEYTELKNTMERKYIPEELFGRHQYSWDINYITGILTCEVKCPCGIEILSNLKKGWVKIT